MLDSAPNYIDVAVLVEVATGEMRLFFELGSQVSFLASAKAKNYNISVNCKNAVKSVNFGYAASLGFQTASGLMVYSGGFTTTSKDNSDGSTKNSGFQLYVGFILGGK